MRKMAKFTPQDVISIRFYGSPQLNEFLLKNKEYIIRETKAKECRVQGKKETFKIEKEITVDGTKVKLFIKKS